MESRRGGIIFVCKYCRKVYKVGKWIKVKDDFWNAALFMGCVVRFKVCGQDDCKK